MRRVGLLITALCGLLAATVSLRLANDRAVSLGPRGLLEEPSRAAYVGGVEVLVDGGFVRSVDGRDVAVRATSLCPRVTLYSSSEVPQRLRLRVTNVWRRRGKATLRVLRGEKGDVVRRDQALAVAIEPGERVTIEVVPPAQAVEEFEFVVIEGGSEGVGDLHALLQQLGADPPAFAVFRDRRLRPGGMRGNWPLVELLEGAYFPVFVVPLHGRESADDDAFARLVGPGRLSLDHAGSRFLLAGLRAEQAADDDATDPLAELGADIAGEHPLRHWLARELGREPECDQAFFFVPFRHPGQLADPLRGAVQAVLGGRRVRLGFVDVMALYELAEDGRLVEAAAARCGEGGPEQCVAWRVRVRRDGSAQVAETRVAEECSQRDLLMDAGARAWTAALRRTPWLGPAGVAVLAAWAALLAALLMQATRRGWAALARRLASQASGPLARARRALGAALVAALVAWLYLDGLGEEHLYSSNEANRVEATREMLLRREFVLPYINGRIYLTKPPLYYWVSAALWPGSPEGGAAVDEFRARLPSVLAAFGCLAVVWGFGRRWLGRGAGALGAFALAASPLFFLQAWQAELDMLLCTLTALSLCLFYEAAWAERRRMAWWVAAFVALAAAAMTKGPVPLAIVAATLLPYLVVTRRQRPRCWPGLLVGGAALLVLVLPWCVAVVGRIGWERAWDIFHQESVRRVGRASEINRGPWHFYVSRLWPTFFPWALWLPAAGLLTWRLARRWREEREGRVLLFLAAWFVPGFVFFSVCAGKEAQYVLPLYPALAMACGALGIRWREGRLTKPERVALGAGTVLAAAAMVGGGLASPAVLAPGLPAGVPLAALLGAGMVLAGAGLLLSWRRRALGGLLAAVVAGFLMAKGLHLAVLVPAGNAKDSPRAFCRRVRERVPPEARLSMYGFERSAYSLYTGRVIPELLTEEELLEAAEAPEPAYFLVRERAYDQVVATHGRFGRVELASLSSYSVYLVANPAAAGRPPRNPAETLK